MLTAVLCTARREPRFDLMADSFVENLNSNPGAAVELIVVDKLLWGGVERIGDILINAVQVRRQQLAAAVNGRFAYRHVSPKPSPWQGPWRKTKKKDYYDLNGARDTGIALARGRRIALFDDCSVLGSQWLRYHLSAVGKNIAIAGSFKSYTKTTSIEGCKVEGELHPAGIDSRGPDAKPAPGGWMYGLNISFPLDAALQINGFDEMYSGQGGSEDCDLGVRLERSGTKIVYMPQCLIYQLLETHEPICEIETWGKPQVVPQKEKLLRDGKMHFANEFLIQELIDEPKRILPRGNDFILSELRREALRTGKFPTERKLTHDWRDGQPLEEM